MERRLSSCSEPWNCNRRIEAAAEGFHIKLEINFNNWFHKNLSNTEAPYPILTPANEGADEMFASVLVFSMVEEWMNKSELYLQHETWIFHWWGGWSKLVLKRTEKFCMKQIVNDFQSWKSYFPKWTLNFKFFT